MRRQGSAGAGRPLRRVRRGRARGRRAPARAGRGLPGRRDAPGRAELPRRAHLRARGEHQRHLRPGGAAAGNVGFVTQSGALGLALIDLAAGRGLGVSSFASIGNRGDITANDFLEYWESDPATEVALLYIESFSDPRRFSRLARRIGREKPIVVVKSGRSVSGGRATGSHTGAMLSASDVTVDALFEQAGVIRTETLSELLDVSSLLADQPLPAGRRVGILTNAGGPGIMCADACEAAGLEVPELPEEVRDSLREFLAPEAALANPVDMIATATAEQYRRAISALAAWEGVDALIVIFIRPLLTRAEDVAEAVRGALAEMPREIPVQAVFMSARDHAAMAATGAVAHPPVPGGRGAGAGAGDAPRRVAGEARRGAAEVPRRADRRGGGGARRGAGRPAENGWGRRRSPSCSTATGSRCRGGESRPARGGGDRRRGAGREGWP